MGIRTRTSSLHLSVMVEPETGEVITFMVVPGGRLTLSTGVPVMTTTVSGATTIYYTPYIGQYIPLWDGTKFSMENFGGELSQLTTDATKSPAAVANNSNYDLFVWSDGGTFRCTRGPAWTSDTARGVGAGTTELTKLQGIYVNANAITNGPVANRGTYVGTVRSNGSSQIDWIFGALAANGTAGFFGVWNAYNRVDVASTSADTTDSWLNTTVTTWRASNGSNTMRCSFMLGLNEESVFAWFSCPINNIAGSQGALGVGLDTTTGYTGQSFWTSFTGSWTTGKAVYNGNPGLGFHYVQATEYSHTSNGTNFGGDNGAPSYVQNGLSILMRM